MQGGRARSLEHRSPVAGVTCHDFPSSTPRPPLGWRDEQIADVVGLVALNLLTGAFNLVAGIHPAGPTQS